MEKQSPKKKGVYLRLDDQLLERLRNVTEHYGQQAHILRTAVEEKVTELERQKNLKAS